MEVTGENIPLVSPDKIENSPQDTKAEDTSTSSNTLEETSDGEKFILEKNYTTEWDKLLSESHEKHLNMAGTGIYQFMMAFILNVCSMGENIELFSLAYILPSAQLELCMDRTRKGILVSSTMLGMFIGALVLGPVADLKGRRFNLLLSLCISVVFGILGSFAPSFWLLFICRLLTGTSFGGIPVSVYTLMVEFAPRRLRGRYIASLMISWTMGSVFVACAALLIIKDEDYSSVEVGEWTFTRWRLFLLVCTLPNLFSLVGTLFLHESPRFLLDCGKRKEAIAVYEKIFQWNNKNVEVPVFDSPERTKKTDSVSTPFYFGYLKTGFSNMKELFSRRFLKVTVLVAMLWVGICIGYYGLSVWFVEYYTLLESHTYKSLKILHANTTYVDNIFQGTVSNTDFINCTFVNATFHDVYISDVQFMNSEFINSSFTDVKSPQCKFIDCYISNTNFTRTDLDGSKFKGVTLSNSSFSAMLDVCQEVSEFHSNQHQVFSNNLIGQALGIPGVLLSLVSVEKIGRIYTATLGLCVCAVSVFFIWFLDTIPGTIAMQTVFNGCAAYIWNSVDLMTPEQVPTHLRSTFWGFCSGCGRLAAFVTNILFAEFIGPIRAIPILMTSGVMGAAGLLALLLPESRDWYT